MALMVLPVFMLGVAAGAMTVVVALWFALRSAERDG